MGFERSIEHWRALPFLSTREAAEVLGVPPRDVRRLVEKNVIEARDLCGREVVIVSSLIALEGGKPGESEQTAPSGTAPLTRDDVRVMRKLRGGLR